MNAEKSALLGTIKKLYYKGFQNTHLVSSHDPPRNFLVSAKKVCAVSRLSLPAWYMGPMRSTCSVSASALRPPYKPSTAVIMNCSHMRQQRVTPIVKYSNI